MKSDKQIRQDKPQMDMEQQECVLRFSIPKTWMVAPELNIFFDQLNKSLFKGILPKVACYWSPPVRSFLGRCHAIVHPKTKNMHSVALEFPCNSPNRMLYTTMIHEMVHVYQTVLGIPLNHNKLFHSINNNKRKTYQQKKGALEPLLYPPRNNKKNKMWTRAHDIEAQLQELSELLFEKPLLIPTCWWHSTKIRTPYTLESYWCHTEQKSKPNTLEFSQKIFSPNEYHLIYILCTIASWRASGGYKRGKYRNELFIRKKHEYFGEPQKDRQDLSEKSNMDIREWVTSLSQYKPKLGQHCTPKLILGGTGSGKTHMLHKLYEYLQNEDV